MSSVAQLPRLVLLASLAAACGSPTEETPTPPPGLTGAGPFVVSNAVTNGAVGAVTYISLPPGTQPGGTVVLIRVERTGMVVSPPLLDGGLDPVAVPAVAGDTVSLTVTRPAGTISVYVTTVPVMRPPVVVRTNPRKDMRDVAVGATTRVVFSEPIDAASLVPLNFELRSAGNTVAGQLSFGTGDRTAVEFTPFADLAGDTEYQLVLRPGIRDSDGTSLEAAPSISFTTEAQPALGFGSVTGVVRLTGGWPALRIDAYGPAQSHRHALRSTNESFESFEFTGLAAGKWTIGFNGMHPWSGVFPDMRLYADTVISVTVLRDQTVILPEMVLRPVAPFIVIATEICPWGFSSPPTSEDWGNCDSGYWGGIDVAVEVLGIAGTATAGARYSLTIPQDRWHVELHGVLAGEYDVSVVPVKTEWRLVSWRSSPVRLRVDRGLAYAEFEYWREK